VDDRSNYLNPMSRALGEFALQRGVLLRPLGNTVYFLPPYCTTVATLEHAYGVVTDFLDAA
jgi:adenosylmethionine-8-amino-7-oxononanoate aminotransferase